MSDTIVQTNITLEELATSMFVNFGLSDPRDAVSSLLSLSKEPLNSYDLEPGAYGDSRIAPTESATQTLWVTLWTTA